MSFCTLSTMSRTSVAITVVPVIINTTFPNPDLIWFKFEPSDFIGLQLKNHATNDYLATCSASGMSSISTFVRGSGSLFMNGSTFVNILSNNTKMTLFTSTQSGTYCIWFNCTQAIPTAGNNNFFLPFAVQYRETFVVMTVGINNFSGNTMIISRINVGGQYIGVGTGTFEINTWNHFSIVVSNTSSGNWTINAYLNGVQISSSVSTNVTNTLITLATSYIGSGNQSFNDSFDQNFVGYVDDFRAYHYALSASQILEVSNTL